MSTNSSQSVKTWTIGDPTKFGEKDQIFLSTMIEEGFSAFTGPSGMFGAETDIRDFVVIHRGRGRRWEIFLREKKKDIGAEITTDLSQATELATAWLNGIEIEEVRELLSKLDCC